MSAEHFLDTNVLGYAFDPTAPAKQQRARELIASTTWVTSWQVIQEFANLALHRFAVPMLPADLDDYLDIVLWPRCVVLPGRALYRQATQFHLTTQYRFYDCLVVASAIASGARILYTEDLQHGRTLGPLTILNPFNV